MKKDYLKPEIEYVKLVACEEISSMPSASMGDEDAGDVTWPED